MYGIFDIFTYIYQQFSINISQMWVNISVPWESVMVDMCLFQVENGDVVGICVSGGLDSKTVALRLRLAGVKVG